MIDGWDQVKDAIMFLLFYNKIEYNAKLRLKNPRLENLKQKLFDTYPGTIIEINRHHDNYWGDCICGRETCLKSGLNRLGEVQMKVRDIFLITSHIML